MIDGQTWNAHRSRPESEVDPRRIPLRLAPELRLVSVIHHVVAGIVEDSENDGEPLADCHENLHPRHLHTAVAANADYAARWVSQGETNGAAHASPHAPEPHLNAETPATGRPQTLHP